MHLDQLLRAMFVASLLSALAFGCACVKTVPTTDPCDPDYVPPRPADLSDLAFLSGQWTTAPDTGSGDVTKEVWSRYDDDLMMGTSLSLRGETLTGFESLVIQRDPETRIVHYIAAPGGREPGTAFELVKSFYGYAVFRNASHDFPNRIIYRLDPQTGYLHASIEGLGAQARGPMEWVFQRAE